MSDTVYYSWNPWHGCKKISPGCKYCYVYRQDKRFNDKIDSSVCKKTANFDLPVKRKRDGSFKIPQGSIISTCFTSDFLLEDADEWRDDCWKMIKERSDCMFLFFTKRILRLTQCLPEDWENGYENVIIGCTVEDQKRADERLPLFLALPIIHRSIICAPLIENIDLSPYLSEKTEEVSVGGESGPSARPCRYEWVLNLREQCIKKDVSFNFHQTGANFYKDGKYYFIKRKYQHSQAKKANINYKTKSGCIPDYS